MTKWKFKIGDIIIWPADRIEVNLIIAKVISRRPRSKTWDFTEYRLLFLNGTFEWDIKEYTERDFKKLNWNIKFFDLFTFNESR